MKKIFYLLVFSLCVLQAQEKNITYSNIFPKNSLAVISFSDIELTKKQFKETYLYSFLQEPEIKKLITEIEKQYSWDNFSKRLKIATGLSLKESLAIFAGEVSVALVDIPSGSEPIQVAVIIDHKQHGENAQKLIDSLIKRVPIEKGSYDVGGQKISYVKGLETALHYTSVDNNLLFATTQKLMSDMLTNISQQGNRLKDTPQYQKSSTIFANSALSYYFDMEKFLHIVEGYMPVKQKVALQSMGVFDWKAICASFAIDKPHFVSRMRLVAKGNKGINRLLHLQPINQNIEKNIPQNSGGWIAKNVNCSELWSEFLRCYNNYEKQLQQQGYPKENSYTTFYDNIRKFEKAFLETTVSEALSSVGPHYALFHLPDPTGGLIPRLVATANTNNPKLLKKVLGMLFDLLHYEFKEKIYKGKTLYYLSRQTTYRGNPIVQINRQQRENLRMLLGTFSFYIDNDQIFITRIVQDLMDLIDTQQSMTPLSISKISPVKQHGLYSFLLYLDWNALLPAVYNTLLPFIPSWEGEISSFLGSDIKSVDIPRMSTIAKYLSPVVGGFEAESEQATFSLRTNFNFDFYVAQGLLWLQLRDVWGPVTSKFFKELDQHLRVNEKVVELVSKNRFYAAYRKWESLEKTAHFESFRLIAKNEKLKLKEKYNGATSQLVNRLQKSFNGALAGWHVTGDWKWQNEELFAKNESPDTFSAVIGENALEDYVIHLEVKDIKSNFQIFFHWNERFNGSPTYKSISFQERKEQQGKWIPLKFKIHKNRISYWYGLKHYVVNANATSGLFGIHLPANSQVRIRNLRLQVEKQIQPEYEEPIVYIQANDTVDPVFQNENTQYFFTVKNQGNKQITNAHLQVDLPESMQFVSASGATYKVIKNRSIVFGPAVIQPNKTLKCKLNVKLLISGSFNVPATITFDDLQGKIVVTERTHVLSE
ncbi:hypothetical protein [Candidatus Uabimicrobium sp. HlEnr_7]|uniref:hypothetical protein n=1 Tax=Candidatus Uabimicrobium helgolandensis TaxID=3095367 RepID=UPI0035576046